MVTAAGRLKSMRHTQLPPVLQRRAARAVKLARQMALMPYELKLGDTGGPGGGGMDSYARRRLAREQQRYSISGEGNLGAASLQEIL